MNDKEKWSDLNWTHSTDHIQITKYCPANWHLILNPGQGCCSLKIHAGVVSVEALLCFFSIHYLTISLTIISPFSPALLFWTTSSPNSFHSNLPSALAIPISPSPGFHILFSPWNRFLNVIMHNSKENSNVDISVCDTPHYRGKKKSGIQLLRERSLQSDESYGSFKKILPLCIWFST